MTISIENKLIKEETQRQQYFTSKKRESLSILLSEK